MKTAATYYIEVDTYWQNSKSYFVGPFKSREAAEAWYAEIPEYANVWLNNSMCGGDIRSAWRVYIGALSKTAATRCGMRDDFEHGYNVLDINIKPTANDLSSAVHSLN